jgi:hypothetical protein
MMDAFQVDASCGIPPGTTTQGMWRVFRTVPGVGIWLEIGILTSPPPHRKRSNRPLSARLTPSLISASRTGVVAL